MNSDHPEKYSYNRFGSKGQRVGQAVMDIISKDQPNMTVEDILEGEGLGRDYLELIREEADRGKKNMDGKFYILSLFTKGLGEMGVSNVLKHSCRSFKKRFSINEVMNAHPNPVKNLFEVDPQVGEIKLLWTLPAYQDCKSIKKNPNLYDPELVKCVMAYFKGEEVAI